jgi:hypothetical protein
MSSVVVVGAKKIPCPPVNFDSPDMDTWLKHEKIVRQPGYPRLEGRNFVKFNSDLRDFWEAQHKLARKRAKDAEKQRKFRASKRKAEESGVQLLEHFTTCVKKISEIDKQIELLQKKRREMVENGHTSE